MFSVPKRVTKGEPFLCFCEPFHGDRARSAAAENLLSGARGRMKSMKIMLYLNQGKIEYCNENGINEMGR